MTPFEEIVLRDIECNVRHATAHDAKMLSMAELAAIATCVVGYTNTAWAGVMVDRIWRDTHFVDAVAGLITWMNLTGDE